MHKSIFFAILSIFLFVAGCGDPNSHTASGTGAVAFSVVWQGAPTFAPAVNGSPGAQAPTLLAQLDCTASGVSTVFAFAYNASDGILASGGPWNCSDHSGTINNIPAQSNVKVVILARDASGNVLYRGEQTGITITAGQTTNIGVLTASAFEPTLTAPSDGSLVTNGSFSFTWTSTGASYKIQASNNSFTSTVIDSAVTATFYTPPPLSAGTYSWRVQSFDSHGNASAWSAVWGFTVAVPSVPTGVTAATGNGQATIAWTPVPGAISYNIYWSTTTGVTTANGNKIAGATSPRTIGLTNGQTYYFIVTAVYSYGESNASTEVGALPDPITPLASSGSTGIGSQWTRIVVDSTSVYWIGALNILKVGLNSGPVTTLASGLTGPAGIAVDSSYVYWTETGGAIGSGTVKKVGLNGGAVTILASGLNWPSGIAIDSSSVYWTDTGGGTQGSGTIMKVGLSTGPVTTLASGLYYPQYIAVSAGSVYWTENGSGTVKSTGLFGGLVTTLASGLSVPADITVDSTGVVYFTEAAGGIGTVKKVGSSGGGPVTTLASGLNFPFGIATDSTAVYWTETSTSGAVKKVGLNGGAAITLASQLNSPWGIAIDSTSVYWATYGDGKVEKVPK